MQETIKVKLGKFKLCNGYTCFQPQKSGYDVEMDMGHFSLALQNWQITTNTIYTKRSRFTFIDRGIERL